MGQKGRVTRRQALTLGTAATVLPLVHIRTAGAAGKLSVGLWDHWVPVGNDALRKLITKWSEQSKVEVNVDFITTVGNKNLLTITSEAQSKTGHDALALPTWEVHNHADQLEPVDDVMSRLQAKYGKIDPITEYLAKADGHWRAVPAPVGTQYKGPCGRISVLKQAGFDPTAVYPAKEGKTPEQASWTWDNFLPLAQKAKAAGMPFALGLGTTSDCVDWSGALFRSFDAAVVDAKGNVTVKSNPKVHQALEYAVKLAEQLPPDVYSFDDASNNRALIAGKSALIFNPPSAWAVAARDNPSVAQDCWTFPAPAGPAGRFLPYLPYFWGIWSFAQNKSAAKDLFEFLSQREQAEAMDNATSGYDIPPFQSMSDFDVWAKVQPPQGTVFNYPIRPWHDAQRSIAAYPAPPDIAVQIYNQGTITNMIAQVTQQKKSIEQALAWAQNEIEGYVR
jgi:ABC-type glycerol-3-phosphate transport system substrate-binding protein